MAQLFEIISSERRAAAVKALDADLSPQAKLLDSAFSLLRVTIDRFAEAAPSSTYASICLVVLIKAKYLSAGTLSLGLDGLGQEAGALARPWIEAMELLRYFSKEPRRVQQVLDGTLPKAGEVAKIVEGDFHKIRQFLNEHASHFRITVQSVRHFVNFETGDVRLEQPFDVVALRSNLSVVYWFTYFLLVEAVHALGAGNIPNEDINDTLDQFEEIAPQIFPLRQPAA